MNREQLEENLVSYLYGELEGSEEQAYREALENFPDLRDEVLSFQKVRQVTRRSLPVEAPPTYLIKEVFQKTKPVKSERWAFLSLWRPATFGALAAALLVVFINRYQQQDFSKRENTVSSEIAFAPSPQLDTFPSPVWKQGRRYGMGLVTPATYGGGVENEYFAAPPSQDLVQLDRQADMAIAQLYYQQAVRLHKMGDHQTAAQLMGTLLRRFPNFPQFYEALALRINCLFHQGDVKQANQELAWLKNRSPELASLLEDKTKR